VTVNERKIETVAEEDDPFALFSVWMAQAQESEPNDPNAMALATVDRDGLPDVRMVLLKNTDPNGFVFYTNANSAKGRQLEATPKAAFVLHWKSVGRQVRGRGPVHRVTDAEADAYFRSRSRDSRIGAWASQQSEPLASRTALDEAFNAYAAKFAREEVPRPPHWTGFRLTPLAIEFWQDRPFRLHERLVFRRPTRHDPWLKQRLFP